MRKGEARPVVLSVIMGTGTDLIAACLEGLDAVGLDYSKNMFTYASSRVNAFFAKEAVRTSYLIDGATDLEGLVDFAASLKAVAEAERAQHMRNVATVIKFLEDAVAAQAVTINADGAALRVVFKLWAR